MTSLYPCPDIKILSNTAVCHYFAKEWMQLGYNVKIIFTYNVYPKYYYPVLKVLKNYLVNKLGIAIQYQYIGGRKDYIYEGVNVSLLPIHKPRPGGGFKSKAINDVLDVIKDICKEENFVPNIVLAHFTHPGLELATVLKEEYKIPCAVSLHGPEPYSEYDKSLFAKCDYVGFRSYPTRWTFEKNYGPKPFFMCPSGVPEKYVAQKRTNFDPSNLSIVYVGTLIERKHPCAIVEAVSNLSSLRTAFVTYIGEGNQKKAIIKSSERNGIKDRIKFTGRIPRDTVVHYLDESDIFVMISEKETFGLVYLEAMARGCIVIASRNEGMDGIIKDGENGFLCNAGDSVELANILKRIASLPSDMLLAISEAGRQTSLSMTDKDVARQYINRFDL